MKFKYIAIFFSFLLSGISLFAQTKSITKLIVDAKTKQPVDYVYVNSDDNKVKLLSTAEGKLILVSDTKIKSFTFYKIGYYAKTISVEELAKSDSVFLNERTYKLSEVNITAQTLEAIVKDKRFYVDDYIALPNNDFIIITSRSSEKECEVAYYQKDKGITCRKKITNETNPAFFTDCFKNIQFLTSRYSRQIFFDSDTSFDFLSKYSRLKFDSTLAKCVLKVDTQLIIKSSLPPRPIKGALYNTKMNSPFLTYNRVWKKNKQHFYTAVFSKQLREMLDNEIGDSRAMIKGMDAEGWKHPSEGSYEAAAALYFEKVGKPIYAPIFLKNDTVVIFNFQENLIVFLSKTGILFKEVKISDDDFSQYRDFEIVYDNVRQLFYYKTKESDKSYLSLMNIYSGKLVKKIHLEKIFAKNIQILDGKIYYLVKEKDWDDTSYLYQQNQ